VSLEQKSLELKGPKPKAKSDSGKGWTTALDRALSDRVLKGGVAYQLGHLEYFLDEAQVGGGEKRPSGK